MSSQTAKSWKDLYFLTAKALANGGKRLSLSRTEWDISGNCEKPYLNEFTGRPEAAKGQQYVEIVPGSRHTLQVDLWTRCRQCKNCLRQRASLWRARAQAETRVAPRTWFGTMTLTAQAQLYYLNKARQSHASKNTDFETLSANEQFKARHKEIGREITLMLKRLRKKKYRFRYLIVAEAHKSGDPHYHCLIHEKDPDRPIPYRILEKEWRLGFSNWKLVEEPRQASYLCKYLSKSLAARVRASRGYGKELDSIPTGLLAKNERDRTDHKEEPFIWTELCRIR